MIELQHVSAGYGAQDVVRDVSFAAPNGQLTALIGPNGSGKTTLLRAMTRTLPCRSGNILLDDRSIASYGRKEFARTAAFMPQSRPVPGITVRALVAHGRFPYLGFSRRMTAQDTAAVEQAMRPQFAGQVDCYRSEACFLEAVPPGVDKAASLHWLLDHLGLSERHLMAFGDGFNDIPMLRAAGLGVAMANAQPPVKAAAKALTDSNDEDGVAHALDKWLLG